MTVFVVRKPDSNPPKYMTKEDTWSEDVLQAEKTTDLYQAWMNARRADGNVCEPYILNRDKEIRRECDRLRKTKNNQGD